MRRKSTACVSTDTRCMNAPTRPSVAL